MARAIANCTCERCGNGFLKIAYKANRRDAENFREWAKGHCTICPDCWKEEQKKKQELALLKYAAEIPQLHGTERQVAWAEDIRRNLIAKTDSDVMPLLQKNRGEKLAIGFLGWLIQDKTDSRFWIDNRDCESLLALPEASKYVDDHIKEVQ